MSVGEGEQHRATQVTFQQPRLPIAIPVFRRSARELAGIDARRYAVVVKFLLPSIQTFMRATRIGAVLILIACGYRSATACSCNRQTVTGAYAEAEIVFEATITAIHGVISNGAWPAGSVEFRVSRVWKGQVPNRFEMPAVQQTGTCLGFYRRLLKPGNALLVYARRLEGGRMESKTISQMLALEQSY